MGTELEGKLKELENLPGHILGLDGWLLRSLPKDKRGTFLEGFEKLIRIAHFPDHAANPQDKTRRERYIQAVANAVSYLKSDEFAWEMAVEDVPSRKNPIIKLKTELEQHQVEREAETSQFENSIVILRDKIEKLEKSFYIASKKVESFERMQEWQNNFNLSSYGNSFSDTGKFLVVGRPIDFSKGKADQLYDVLFRNISRAKQNPLSECKSEVEQTYNAFKEVIENQFLAGEKKALLFNKGKARKGRYGLRFLGSLSPAAIREFALQEHLNGPKYQDKISTIELKTALKTLCPEDKVCSNEFYSHMSALNPFLSQSVYLNYPIVLFENGMNNEVISQRVNLFYVEGINPNPK